MGKTIKTGMINAKINGIKVDTSKPCSSGNRDNMLSRLVKYIVMHYTGNYKDTAWANANYFQTGGRDASAHFFVDDTEIYQSVELRDVAWHCGTTGTYYHSQCRNSNSIGIEMCCTAGRYKISKETQKNAAHLCAYLCKELGITAKEVDTYVLRHYDVTRKDCPAQMAGAGNDEWEAFKDMVRDILKAGSKAKEKDTAKKKAEKEKSTTYTKKQFVKDVQKAIGAEVDGIVGPETLSKLVTLSKSKNTRHAAVKPVQKRLNALGYNCGTADGIAGPKFDSAVKKFQKAKGCVVDGEITAGAKTWKKLLEV